MISVLVPAFAHQRRPQRKQQAGRDAARRCGQSAGKDPRQTAKVHRLPHALGQQMAEHPCAGLYAITADMEFESHYGKRANKRRKMYNGMIPCQLYMYYEAPKFEHKAKPMPKQGFDGKRTVEFKKK